MESYPPPIPENRPLTTEEQRLARWMLEHGGPEAQAYLPQLDRAWVVSRCACGCATLDLQVEGFPPPSGGMRLLGDYTFEANGEVSGIFIYHRGGTLAGIEVYGLSGDTPETLPAPESLIPMAAAEDSARE
ncbi:MAG TPA: hypothetical protein VFT45_07550 [Longimicrobium sp.]|nr:hypothetical protein [Longimicrobium sp.]